MSDKVSFMGTRDWWFSIKEIVFYVKRNRLLLVIFPIALRMLLEHTEMSTFTM